VDVSPAVSCEQAGQLVQAFRPGWRVLRVWPFAGAVSSQIRGIEVAGTDGARRVFVVRQYRAANAEVVPPIADAEYRLLRLLTAAGLPVPWPCLADDSGVAGPCLVMEYIDGERVHKPADLPSFLRQLAAALAAVHDSGVARADLSFLPDAGDQVLDELRTGPHTADDAVPESAIRSALRARWPPEQASEPVVLHGDYWPGNVQWRDGRIAAIIDWEEAAFGDPMADWLTSGWRLPGTSAQPPWTRSLTPTSRIGPPAEPPHSRHGTCAPPCGPASTRSKRCPWQLQRSPRCALPTPSSPRPRWTSYELPLAAPVGSFGTQGQGAVWSSRRLLAGALAWLSPARSRGAGNRRLCGRLARGAGRLASPLRWPPACW